MTRPGGPIPYRASRTPWPPTGTRPGATPTLGRTDDGAFRRRLTWGDRRGRTHPGRWTQGSGVGTERAPESGSRKRLEQSTGRLSGGAQRGAFDRAEMRDNEANDNRAGLKIECTSDLIRRRLLPLICRHQAPLRRHVPITKMSLNPSCLCIEIMDVTRSDSTE